MTKTAYSVTTVHGNFGLIVQDNEEATIRQGKTQANKVVSAYEAARLILNRGFARESEMIHDGEQNRMIRPGIDFFISAKEIRQKVFEANAPKLKSAMREYRGHNISVRNARTKLYRVLLNRRFLFSAPSLGAAIAAIDNRLAKVNAEIQA